MTPESSLFRYYAVDKLGMREPRDGEKPLNSDSILRNSALVDCTFMVTQDVNINSVVGVRVWLKSKENWRLRCVFLLYTRSDGKSKFFP